jgi:predicted flavoprotein YhiN
VQRRCRRLCHALTELPLPVVRDRGWNYAEVTAGGVPLGEIDPHGAVAPCARPLSAAS